MSSGSPYRDATQAASPLEAAAMGWRWCCAFKSAGRRDLLPRKYIATGNPFWNEDEMKHSRLEEALACSPQHPTEAGEEGLFELTVLGCGPSWWGPHGGGSPSQRHQREPGRRLLVHGPGNREGDGDTP